MSNNKADGGVFLVPQQYYLDYMLDLKHDGCVQIIPKGFVEGIANISVNIEPINEEDIVKAVNSVLNRKEDK